MFATLAAVCGLRIGGLVSVVGEERGCQNTGGRTEAVGPVNPGAGAAAEMSIGCQGFLLLQPTLVFIAEVLALLFRSFNDKSSVFLYKALCPLPKRLNPRRLSSLRSYCTCQSTEIMRTCVCEKGRDEKWERATLLSRVGWNAYPSDTISH